MMNQFVKSNILLNRLANTTNTLKSLPIRLYQCRRLSSESAAYDGDGKTTVRVLNNEESHLNMVNTYSTQGFRLSNNVFINGSIILFPTYVFSWNIRRGIDITPESLLLFDLIVPKIKIVVIGYGDADEPHDLKIPLILKKRGISCEFLPTPNAVTTYNFLVTDALHVAGAFVPTLQEPNATVRDTRALGEYDYMVKDTDYFNNREPFQHETYMRKFPERFKKTGDVTGKDFNP